ncbi:MAG: deoxyribose-phosphate aldolase [Calditrichaeota bacterium]|nr:deoxyribose-phosphate aldolase [Calditrichota bacterium]
MIDHTLLKPEATEEQIVQLCAEAKIHHFASVCVNPVWAALCAQELHGSDVMVCSVIGFPLGANTTRMKTRETAGAVADGADEIDMVIHVGKLKAGDLHSVHTDIHEVVRAADGRHVKVIIETCLLTDEEKVAACTVAKLAGAHFVKTSTGFNKAGATIQDVNLMRKVVGDEMGVKAAGGIRDYEKAMEMIRAGANRIGASASISIVGN